MGEERGCPAAPACPQGGGDEGICSPFPRAANLIWQRNSILQVGCSAGTMHAMAKGCVPLVLAEAEF